MRERTKRMNRREFLKSAGLFAAAAVGGPALSRAGEVAERLGRRPNVIFCFSDEHRWQSMSFTEMPRMKTPNMQRMAESGVSFTNAISNYPVCSPHRAILMTGRWPYQQKMKGGSPGMIDNGLDLSPEQTTIGKAFKAAGYRTGYIGKWHLGGTASAEPFGFDLSVIWSGTNNHWNSTYHAKGEGKKVCKRYNATAMMDQALKFVEDSAANPFFLILSLNPPHSKFTDPPKEKAQLYQKEKLLDARPNAGGKGATAAAFRGYHAHVSAVDDELGRLMDKLDKLGIAGDTILVYSSDHGSMLGSHGVGSKRQPYEESIRVPLLMRWPGRIPGGQRPATLFGTIDIMPTLLGLAGAKVPETCSGQDLSAVALGRGGPQPDSQFIMHICKKGSSQGDRHPAPLFRGVRTDRYTLAICEGRPHMLFDNVADPYQKKNLYEDPAAAEVRRDMRARLAKWLEKANDPFKPAAAGEGKK